MWDLKLFERLAALPRVGFVTTGHLDHRAALRARTIPHSHNIGRQSMVLQNGEVGLVHLRGSRIPCNQRHHNPNTPVARLNAWQKQGAQLRILLDRALEDDDTIPYVNG